MFENMELAGEDDTVRKIVQAAVDLVQKLSGKSRFLQAVKSGKESLIEMLIRAKGDRSALAIELAAMLGYVKLVKGLVRAGAVVTDRSLNFAITNGHADVLQTLLSSGVCIADQGEKLLLDALTSGKKDVVKTLLEFGAHINDCNAFSEALRHTVVDGNLECIEALQHADMLDSTVEIIDLAKLAAERGHLALYRYLIGMSLQKDGPVYQKISQTPHRSKLPFSSVIDYKMTHRRTDQNFSTGVNRAVLLDKQFLITSEICVLPGYGNVQSMPDMIAKKCAAFCEKVVTESVDNGKIREYRFPLTLMRCGSSAEGTKVGLPDEMDFLFLLHTDPNSIVIKNRGEGYKKIEVEEEHANSLRQKLISAGSKLFHDAFIGLVMTQARHRDKIKSAQKIVTVGGSASSEWVLRYDIDAERSFDISVDLVPAIHILDWPSDAVQSTWMMTKDALESEGYALVAKPPSRKSDFGRKLRTNEQERTWRISFAHLETKHLAGLEQRLKDVYITCKSLRDPDICYIMFKDSQGKYLSTSKDLVTSYMLKMVFMHNVQGFLQKKMSLVEMVYIVYNQLARCIAEWFIPFFWQPHVNVLEGLKQDPVQCKQAIRIIQSLVTARFVRDGERDSVEEECSKSGGVYPYLPSRATDTAHAHESSCDLEKNAESGDSPTIDKSSSLDDWFEENCEVLIYSRGGTCDVGYIVYQLE
jgi:hypothetical protein